MTVTNIHKDPKAKTMTITSEFDAPLARVWQLWEDPRQLENHASSRSGGVRRRIRQRSSTTTSRRAEPSTTS